MKEKVSIFPYISYQSLGQLSLSGTPYHEDSPELKVLKELDEIGWKLTEDGEFYESDNLLTCCPTYYEAQNLFLSVSQENQGYQLEVPAFSIFEIPFLLHAYCHPLEPTPDAHKEFKIRFPKSSQEELINHQIYSSEPLKFNDEEKRGMMIAAQKNQQPLLTIYFSHELIKGCSNPNNLSYGFLAKAAAFKMLGFRILGTSKDPELYQYLGIYYLMHSTINLLETLKSIGSANFNSSYQKEFEQRVHKQLTALLEENLMDNQPFLNKALLYLPLIKYADASNTLYDQDDLIPFFLKSTDPEHVYLLCHKIDQENILLSLNSYLALFSSLLEVTHQPPVKKNRKQLIVNLCNSALSAYPTNSTALYTKATELLLAAGKLSNALQPLQSLIDSNLEFFLQISMPNAPELHHNLAKHLSEQNYSEIAFDFYQNAILYGIKNTKAHKKLLDCSLNIISLSQELDKEKNLAQPVTQKIVRLLSTAQVYAQNESLPYDDLTLFLLKQKDPKPLCLLCDELLKNNIVLNLKTWLDLLSSLPKYTLSRDQKAQMSTLCDTVLFQYPNEIVLYERTTQLLFAFGKTQKVTQRFKGLIDSDYERFLQISIPDCPHSAQLYYELAEYLSEKNHLETAFDHYQKAISQGIKNTKNKKKRSECCLNMLRLSRDLHKNTEDLDNSEIEAIVQLAVTNPQLHQEIQKFLDNLNPEILIESNSLLYQILIEMIDRLSEKPLDKKTHLNKLIAFYQALSNHIKDSEDLDRYQDIISSYHQKEIPESMPQIIESPIQILENEENKDQLKEKLALPDHVIEIFHHLTQILNNDQVYLKGDQVRLLLKDPISPSPYDWNFVIFIAPPFQDELLLSNQFWKSQKQPGLYTKKIASSEGKEQIIKVFYIPFDPNQSIETQLENNVALQAFTIDSLMVSPDGIVYDFLNATQDLQDKTLRMINPTIEQLQENPTLVLRAIKYQLEGFHWAETLKTLVTQWAEQLDHLPLQKETHVQAVITKHLYSLDQPHQQAYVDLLVDYAFWDKYLDAEKQRNLQKTFNLTIPQKEEEPPPPSNNAYPRFNFNTNAQDFSFNNQQRVPNRYPNPYGYYYIYPFY